MSPGNYHYGAESKGQQQLAQEGSRVFPTASTGARLTVPPVGPSPGFTGLYLLDDEWRPPSRTAAAGLTSKSVLGTGSSFPSQAYGAHTPLLYTPGSALRIHTPPMASHLTHSIPIIMLLWDPQHFEAVWPPKGCVSPIRLVAP